MDSKSNKQVTSKTGDLRVEHNSIVNKIIITDKAGLHSLIILLLSEDLNALALRVKDT